MRKFLITNPKYTGVAEVFYNEKGTLCKIDLAQTNMDERIVQHFKCALPVTIHNMEGGIGFSKDTVVVESDFEVTFLMFWDAYKKKIKLSRCQALWVKLTKVEQVQAYYGINIYDKYLHCERWRSKADPETYLRNKYWENEYK